MKTSILKKSSRKYFHFLMMFNEILIFSLLILLGFFYDNKIKVSGITVYFLSMSEALKLTEPFKVSLIPKQSVNTYTDTLTTWFSLPHNHFSSIIANVINIFHFPALSHLSLYFQSIHSKVYQESTSASGRFQNLWECVRGPVCSFWKILLFSCTAIFLQRTRPTNPLAYCTKIFK